MDELTTPLYRASRLTYMTFFTFFVGSCAGSRHLHRTDLFSVGRGWPFCSRLVEVGTKIPITIVAGRSLSNSIVLPLRGSLRLSTFLSMDRCSLRRLLEDFVRFCRFAYRGDYAPTIESTGLSRRRKTSWAWLRLHSRQL